MFLQRVDKRPTQKEFGSPLQNSMPDEQCPGIPFMHKAAPSPWLNSISLGNPLVTAAEMIPVESSFPKALRFGDLSCGVKRASTVSGQRSLLSFSSRLINTLI